MRGLGATSLVGGGGRQLPLTRLLVHFDNAAMPPVDERGGVYTVIEPGQALVGADARFGERCLHNNRGCGYFTPAIPDFYKVGHEDWCLEIFVKLDPSGEWPYYANDANAVFTGIVANEKDTIIHLGNVNRYFLGNLDMEQNKWSHISYYKYSGTAYASCNGSVINLGSFPARLQGDRIILSTPPNSSVPGSHWENSYGVHGVPLLGHLDELRFSVGTSRYGPNHFTPPSSPFVLD